MKKYLSLALALIMLLASGCSSNAPAETEAPAEPVATEAPADYYEMGKASLAEEDYSKAFEYFKNAAEDGNADAMYNIALLYENGYGVPQSDRTAFNWYLKAADAGNAVAMRQVGLSYMSNEAWTADGRKTRDFDKSMSYLSKAFEAGDTDSGTYIGEFYEYGEMVHKNPVEKDLEKAREYYTKAAEGGNTLAMYRFGYSYISEDEDKAWEWILKAAEAGNDIAMSEVGYMYAVGWIVEKDHAQAFEWLQKGAEAGNTRAMRDLATLYENGLGVEQNAALAQEWNDKAAELDAKS